jgi:hypothetical protein
MPGKTHYRFVGTSVHAWKTHYRFVGTSIHAWKTHYRFVETSVHAWENTLSFRRNKCSCLEKHIIVSYEQVFMFRTSILVP